MRLAVYVMHVPGIPSRAEALNKLLERCPNAVVMRDPERKGAWWNAERCWTHGLSMGADWIVVLNDDALPCENFEITCEKALKDRNPLNPVCLYATHPRAPEVKFHELGYTTYDGLVGVGCALSAKAARDFLQWVKDNPGVDDYSDDGRINLWAMATDRLVLTLVPSLVDHQLPDETTVPWSETDARTSSAPPSEALVQKPWGGWPRWFGRARAGLHWEMLFRAKSVTPSLIERAYLIERGGPDYGDSTDEDIRRCEEHEASPPTHVFIAMPAARNPELAVRVSVQRVVADLEEHGIKATFFESPGDSLVTRGRHNLCHEFLRSTATHFLQWDDDVECLDPTAGRRMVETGQHVIGGAYPWRDGSGRVVANPKVDDVHAGAVDIDPRSKCIRVAEVGTGFLMVTRSCFVDLCVKHRELMYMADIEPYVGAPMWALFDAGLEFRPETGRMRYASEDWRFCSLAREAGYEIVVYYPPVFRHWGKKAHEGHILRAWGLNKSREVKEAAE